MTAGAGVPDTRTLTTTPDVDIAAQAMQQYDEQYDEQWQLGMAPGGWTGCASTALDAVAPRLRARWVAEALEDVAEKIAERCGHKDYRDRGTGDGSFEDRWREPKIWPPDLCPFCSKDTELVRALAAEYRDGTR